MFTLNPRPVPTPAEVRTLARRDGCDIDLTGRPCHGRAAYVKVAFYSLRFFCPTHARKVHIDAPLADTDALIEALEGYLP